jgi:hypothetical protein
MRGPRDRQERDRHDGRQWISRAQPNKSEGQEAATLREVEKIAAQLRGWEVGPLP